MGSKGLVSLLATLMAVTTTQGVKVPGSFTWRQADAGVVPEYGY